MKLCIRAHDLGVMGTEGVVSRLEELGIQDGDTVDIHDLEFEYQR